MINFVEIINRLKKFKSITSDKEFAKILGISPPDFSKRKKIGTLLPLIVNWGLAENVNLNWVLRGEGVPYIKEGEKHIPKADADPSLLNKVKNLDDDPEVIDLLTRTIEILKSKTGYSVSLAANIRSFHHAVKTENRLNGVESRLAAIEQQQARPDEIREKDPPEQKEALIKKRAM